MEETVLLTVRQVGEREVGEGKGQKTLIKCNEINNPIVPKL